MITFIGNMLDRLLEGDLEWLTLSVMWLGIAVIWVCLALAIIYIPFFMAGFLLVVVIKLISWVIK